MTEFLYFVSIGIATGSVYALAGVGLSVVFSSSRLLNFAQGYLVVIGALVGAAVANGSFGSFALALVLAALASMAVSVAGGLGLCWAMLRRDADIDLLMIGTVGLAIAIENALPGISGRDPTQLASPIPDGGVQLGGAFVPWGYVVMLGGSMLVALGVLALYRFTDLGLRLRALANDLEAAQSAGINARSGLVLAWALSGVLGGVAGVLIAIQVPVEYNDGLSLSIFGFAAAMIGGLASPAGSFVGGLAYGLIQGLAAAYLPGTVQPFIAPAIILAVITLRPGGLLPVRQLREV